VIFTLVYLIARSVLGLLVAGVQPASLYDVTVLNRRSARSGRRRLAEADSGQVQSAWMAAPHSGQRNGRRWATARQMA
jgi:hypothetical protein